MCVYVPRNVSPHPAVVVAAHQCGGSASAMYSGTEGPSPADRHGFAGAARHREVSW